MTSPALAVDPRPDPLKQSEIWLWQCATASGLKWGPPAAGFVMRFVRMMFDAGKTLEDLEILLQGLLARHEKPRADGSYAWYLTVAKSAWEEYGG